MVQRKRCNGRGMWHTRVKLDSFTLSIGKSKAGGDRFAGHVRPFA